MVLLPVIFYVVPGYQSRKEHFPPKPCTAPTFPSPTPTHTGTVYNKGILYSPHLSASYMLEMNLTLPSSGAPVRRVSAPHSIPEGTRPRSSTSKHEKHLSRWMRRCRSASIGRGRFRSGSRLPPVAARRPRWPGGGKSPTSANTLGRCRKQHGSEY